MPTLNRDKGELLRSELPIIGSSRMSSNVMPGDRQIGITRTRCPRIKCKRHFAGDSLIIELMMITSRGWWLTYLQLVPDDVFSRASTEQDFFAKGCAMRNVLLCETRSAVSYEAAEASTINKSKSLNEGVRRDG